MAENYKNIGNIQRWYDTGKIAIDLGHGAPYILSVDDSKQFLKEQGLELESLKEYKGNVGGWNTNIGDLRKKQEREFKIIESNKKAAEEMEILNKQTQIAPTANSIAQSVYGMNADDATLKKIVAAGVTDEKSIRKIILENPREQTEFGKEFKRRKEAGESTDSILKDIQSDETGKVFLRPKIEEPIEKKTTNLKNKNIAGANPSEIANAGFVNALYNEKFSRNATQGELDAFKGKTVKHASDVILGKDLSPFIDVKTPPPATPPPAQQKLPDLPVDKSGNVDFGQMDLRSKMPIYDIPFREGLSQEQKDNIRKLTEKPTQSWSETDKKNWEYATGNKDYGKPKNITQEEGVPIGKGEKTPLIEYGQPAQKKFYRVGQDIFDASTKQRITYDDWAANWAGKATEVDTPAQQPPAQQPPEQTMRLPEDLRTKLYEATRRVKPTPENIEDFQYDQALFERQLDDMISEGKSKVDSDKTKQITDYWADGDAELTFVDPEKGAYIQFAGDPDGAGPFTKDTVFYVDSKSKGLHAISTPEAFDAFSEVPLGEAIKQGLIRTLPMNFLDKGQPLGDYKVLTDEYSIKADGKYKQYEVATTVERYGQPVNEEHHREALTGVVNYIDNILRTSDIPKEEIDALLRDKDKLYLYVNAVAYGGYNMNDIYRDAKRNQLIKGGRADLENIKVIDPNVDAGTYYNTAEGKLAKSTPDISPPAYLADVDSSLFDNPIFKIPEEAYKLLLDIPDWNSPEMDAELDKIKSSYHDMLTQELRAGTERERLIALENRKIFNREINRKYGIQLSDNANEAWNQLGSLGKTFAGAGLAGTGLETEARERYLADVRKADERGRESKLTEEEQEKRLYYLKNATPEEIAALSDEDKIKYGLKPSAEVLKFFDEEYLKSQYPDLSDAEIKSIKNSIVDEQGNYRSETYQKQFSGLQDIEKEKRAFQESTFLGKKEFEADKAYEQFTRGKFEKASPVAKQKTASGLTYEEIKARNKNAPAGWEISPTTGKLAKETTTPTIPDLGPIPKTTDPEFPKQVTWNPPSPEYSKISYPETQKPDWKKDWDDIQVHGTQGESGSFLFGKRKKNNL